MLFAGLTLAALVGAGLVPLGATAASADTRPIIVGEPVTASSDSLPAPQIDGVVWAQTVVGDTVFVAGDFDTARPAGSPAGSNQVTRSNLLAYNVTTGVLDSTFKPNVNEQIRAIAASPDGTKLFIGGNFTAVNGQSRNRIASFDIASEALTAFNPDANFTVNSIVADNATVWFGGGFSSVGEETRIGAAAVSLATNTLLPWAPVLGEGKANGIALSPDGTKIALGGNFISLNGATDPGYGLGMVPSTGTGTTNLPFKTNSVIRNAGVNSSITSLSSDADGIYGSGYKFGVGGNFEGSFRASWDDGTLIWLEDCHGDTYSVWASKDFVYKASHAHFCGNIGAFPETTPKTVLRAIAHTKAATSVVTANTVGNYTNFAGNPAPTQANWYPTINTGTFTGAGQGAWSVSGDSRYVLFGGEFTQVNGKGQQGLARFPMAAIAANDDGPRVSGVNFPLTATARSAGSVTLNFTANWDRDNELLTYRVYRAGVSAPVGEFNASSRVWRRAALSFVDTGLEPGASYTYTVRAVDPFGNSATSAPVTAAAGAGTPVPGYQATVLDDSPRHYWRLGEASGVNSSDVANGTILAARAGVTRKTAGALVGDANTASTFSGTSTGFATTTGTQAAPQTFTVEAWFKTASTAGGKVIGFGNSATAGSSLTDRHIYLDASGRVNFGVYQNANRTVTSSAAFNDNAWHHTAATLDASGMKLYIDGVLVAQRADTTSARVGIGYWRVGGDTSWSGNGYLAGSVDEAAVYFGALSSGRIAAHNAAGRGTVPANKAPVASFTTASSGLTATFDAGTSSDSDGSIAGYSWNFGDSTTGAGATISHAYAAAGTYTAQLTVTDDDGASATSSKTVVVTAPPVPQDGTLASDSFGRSTTNAWGSATTGGAWTTSATASSFSVDGTRGQIAAATAGSNLVARLGSTGSTAVDAQVTTALTTPVSGAPGYVSLLGRSVGTEDYRARLAFSTTPGQVNLQLLRGGTTLVAAPVSGLSYATGDQLRLRVRVTGTSPTTIQAKVWRVGAAEPAGWLLTTTDATPSLQVAGGVGLGLYVGGSATGLPARATFDDLLVSTVQ